MSVRAAALPLSDMPVLPRAMLPVGFAIGALLLLVALVHALRPLLNRPLHGLRIEGQLNHLNAAQVGAAAALPPGTGLLDADLQTVRARVEGLPWVGHAQVRRVWPDSLAIAVSERQAFARWGASSLVDTEGRVFTPPAADLPAGLPRLEGPAERARQVMTTFTGLAIALNDSPFHPAGLSLDDRGSWVLTSTRGIALRLGEGVPADKAALIRGVVARTLAGKLGQVAYIDLRYTNGFAVGWSGLDVCTPAPAAPKAATKAPAVAPAADCSEPAGFTVLAGTGGVR